MAEVVECRGVGKTYEDGVPVPALRDLDLRIGAGDLTAIVGHSGSGKSTLLNLIGGLDRPTEGEVLIEGVALSSLNEDALARVRNRKVGFVFQFHYLLTDFAAWENVSMPLRIGGESSRRALRERAVELLAAVGLEDKAGRRPEQLSGGEQQRVAIARALIHHPAVVLADEPTGNLDLENSQLVFDLFRRLNQEQGITIIVVTHDEELALQTDRIVRLHYGQIIDDNPTA